MHLAIDMFRASTRDDHGCCGAVYQVANPNAEWCGRRGTILIFSEKQRFAYPRLVNVDCMAFQVGSVLAQYVLVWSEANASIWHSGFW